MTVQSNRLTAVLVVMTGLLISGCGEAPAPTDTAAAPETVQQDVPTPVAETPAPAALDGAPADTAGAVTEPASAAALKYDNQIVHQPEAGRGKDDGWFLVKDGMRRWITDDKWPAANGYDPHKVIYITPEEFSSIPEDPRPLPNPEETATQ